MIVRVLRIAALSLLAACGKRERPPAPDRPTQPTLTLAPDTRAPRDGRRVVAFGQIDQPWHTGAFKPASITLPEVQAGDAIIALGVFWGDLASGSSTAPTDDHGALVRVVDHGPAVVGVGRMKPPVFAQVYAELDAAPGPHTIVPAYLGGPAGDGTLYVVQVRGLTDHKVIGVGHTRVKGDAMTSVTATLAGAVAAGDLVLAVGGYDNTKPTEHPGWVAVADGWRTLGAQSDSANNVPSQLHVHRANAAGPMALTWAWLDPTVNIVAAAIVALR